MGWTKKELENKNYEAYAPQVIKVWEAPYNEWKKIIEEIGVDQNTILVGLSAGAAAITRYIVEEKKQIKKLILVAPAGFTKDGSPYSMNDGDYNFENNDAVPKQIKNGVTIFFDPADFPDIVKSVEIYTQRRYMKLKKILTYVLRTEMLIR